MAGSDGSSVARALVVPAGSVLPAGGARSAPGEERRAARVVPRIVPRVIPRIVPGVIEGELLPPPDSGPLPDRSPPIHRRGPGAQRRTSPNRIGAGSRIPLSGLGRSAGGVDPAMAAAAYARNAYLPAPVRRRLHLIA